MKSRLKHIITASWMVLTLTQIFMHADPLEAAIPVEYTPNYKISSQWNDIQDLLVKIQASKQVGNSIDTLIFTKLYENFSYVFDYFPKKPEFRTVYEQCLITTQTLSRGFDYNNFSLFNNNCFGPLQSIIKEINTNYTVAPKAEALYDTASNSAPLTVTFDARLSQDPSNTTIPTDHFYWYYRDVDGEEKTIGNGSVVKYTFTKAGNYKVRLTVRSVNNSDEGIFDGEQVIDINVTPQAANIAIFANGKKMNDQMPTKLGTQEAQKGIRFDGSATTPLGGRQILWHEWQIEGDNKFSQISSANTAPNVLQLALQNNGLYAVKLSVRDNEGNTVSKTYQLVISDPVATIKQAPANGGNTTTTYSFDASTSYSVISNLKTFSWTIYDENGNILEALQNQKTIQKQFPKPGNYTVVLKITDEQGQENQDMVKVFVDSATPVPQFTMLPTQQWKYPSEYIFNASASSDYDVTNGSDALSYEWNFSNGESAKVQQSFDDGKRVLVSFEEKGTYNIRLTVKDKFGKIANIEKKLDIASSLRPYIFVTPVATTLGNTTNFLVKSNKTLVSYQWDFGDQQKNIVQADKTSHTYKQSGAYKVKLIATSPSGEENEVQAMAFIGDRDAPIPSYRIFNRQGTVVMPEGVCNQPNLGSVPAYNIDRYEDVTIDGSESININGQRNNLKYYFKPANDDVTQNQQMRHSFDQLGCHVVDFTVEDTQSGKTSNAKIWINVQNSKPTLDNLRISFPQYGNTQGIGFGQSAQQDIFTLNYDPLIVRIDAVNPRDIDGGVQGVSKYRWYYYNTQDPERILEVKVTPGNTPYVFFSLPRIAGEYRFGVEMYDNDDAEGIRSEDIIGNGPIVVFPPDSKNPDIPIVTLIVDRPTAKVGETVNLEVKSSVLTNMDDFAANRVIRYDFDGDGTDDLSTRDTKVTYVYEKDGIFTPRAKVIYRGRSGIAKGQSVNVEKGTKAQFLYATIGDKVIIRDISLGDITAKTFCLDIKTCKTNSNLLIENRSYFTVTYPVAGRYAIQYDVADKFGNSSRQRGLLDIVGPTPATDAIIVTLPAPDVTTGGNATVQIGKGLDNTVLFYVAYDGKGDCYIDKDITSDSNKDGTPDQDRDMACNQETMIKYTPQYDSSIARAYYEKDGVLLTKDVSIEFIDFDNTLPEGLKNTYNELNQLIDAAPESAAFLKTLLLNLRNNLIDPASAQSIIIQIHDYLDTNPDQITGDLRTRIIQAIVLLTNESGQSALGGTDYQNAKQGILYLLPGTRRLNVENVFIGIESADGDKGVIRDDLDKIMSEAQAAFDNKEIDAEDFSQIQQERCRIINYYSIDGTTCASEDTTTPEPVATTTESSGWGTVLTIIIWIVAILGGGFVILVVIFALKARMQKKEEDAANAGSVPMVPVNNTAATPPPSVPTTTSTTPPPPSTPQ